MENLTSGRRSSATEYAYRSLKKQIINGALLPNQSIVEQSLSKELEVSRTPLREAIQRLEFEDLLIRKANGRLKVAPISIKEVEEIFIVRGKMEAIAVEQAIDNMKEKDRKNLSHLSFMIEEMHKQKLIGEVVRYGEEFHKYIYQLSDNKTVIKILLQLKDHVDRYKRLIPIKDSNKNDKSSNDHKLILEYMIHKKKKEASEAMENHIIKSMHSIVEKIKNDERIQ
ncbi:MAG TPA: GntR family transcriptional regulator [Pseudogracilibacillus sp.]|nr:GntR family transcriptional regulator [Pseudogracilibacillus sp.]